jgi:hypothetical protein
MLNTGYSRAHSRLVNIAGLLTRALLTLLNEVVESIRSDHITLNRSKIRITRDTDFAQN